MAHLDKINTKYVNKLFKKCVTIELIEKILALSENHKRMRKRYYYRKKGYKNERRNN